MDSTATERRRARRMARAARTRARALSPLRIVASLLSIPPLAVAIGTAVYLRVSDYPPGDAMRHLVARAGCEAAAAVNLVPAGQGRLGYHRRNDADGDGVACNEGLFVSAAPPAARAAIPAALPEALADPAPEAPAARIVGGAKFLRP